MSAAMSALVTIIHRDLLLVMRRKSEVLTALFFFALALADTISLDALILGFSILFLFVFFELNRFF